VSTPLPNRFLELVEKRIVAAADAQAPTQLHQCLCDLDHVLLSEQEIVLRLPAAAEAMRHSQEIYGPFETMLERTVVDSLLGSLPGASRMFNGISSAYLQRYRSLAGHEAKLAGIGPGDHVLFIGSGPFPITAIEYVRQTGCRVTCVEQLAEAVETSAIILRHLGLDQQIATAHARGQNYNMADHSVILVGVLAEPKDLILRRLDKHADASCRILCRTTIGVRRFIYPRTVPYPLQCFNPADFIRAAGDQVISIQLLRRAGQAPCWEVRAPTEITTTKGGANPAHTDCRVHPP
jgi:hypothetical protein